MVVIIIVINLISELAYCQDTLNIDKRFNPDTGEIIIEKFNPNTGQLEKKNQIKENYNKQKSLNYNQIKSLIKTNARNNFDEKNWIVAGFGGCGFGIVFGVPGLILPPLIGYYLLNDIEVKGMPDGITSTQVMMYQKEYKKEIKRLRIKSSFKGNGIGCIVTLIAVVGLL